MLARLGTFALVGIEAVPVEVEVDNASGTVKSVLVGLPGNGGRGFLLISSNGMDYNHLTVRSSGILPPTKSGGVPNQY